MSEKYLYEKEWKDYKLRKFLPFLGFFVWMVVVICAALVSPITGRMNRDLGFSPGLIIFVLVTTGVALATLYSSLWRCPRCKKYFGAADGLDIFTKKAWRATRCRNCTLPRFYGSSFFVEYWGKEAADKFKEQIEMEKAPDQK
jgi:hypothetical protein